MPTLHHRRHQCHFIEFGLQHRDGDSWGDRILPQRRFFPSAATVDRWLGSSTIDLDT